MKNKVEIIWGEARLLKPSVVEVSKPTKSAVQPQAPEPKKAMGPGVYEARHVVIATGARPRRLRNLPTDGRLVWSYFEAMTPPALPKSLLVVGSGAIGVEFASFYSALGTKVTIVEMVERILPAEDREISDFVRRCLEKQGLTVLTGAEVVEVGRNAGSVAVVVKQGARQSTMDFDRVIVAVGVQGNVENLGLEEIGVKVERGGVVCDGVGRTNIDGICAIGDVSGPPMLAHKAEREAVICVEALAGLKPRPLARDQIPACTYCVPQVASVGLSEAKAKASGFRA